MKLSSQSLQNTREKPGESTQKSTATIARMQEKKLCQEKSWVDHSTDQVTKTL